MIGKNEKSVSSFSIGIISLIFFVLLFYNCHRYVFRYNSVFTSPTYENTPIGWQVGKYLMVSILLGFLYARCKFGARTNFLFRFFFPCVLALLAINILNTLIYGELFWDELEYIFFFLLLAPLLLIKRSIVDYIETKLNSAFYVSSVILILGNIFVIANYLITGRMPALAYQGLIVRFGGLWDDPNGFGFACVFLFFWSYFNKHYLQAILLFLSIVSTLSVSALILFMVSAIYWSNIQRLRIDRTLATLLILLSTFGLGGVILLWQKIVDLYQYKVKSIQAHTTFDLHFSILPLMKGPLQFHETWVASFFVNYFPVSLFVLIVFVAFIAFSFLSKKKGYVQYFLLLFIVGNVFIPFFYNFPLNFIFILFAVILVRRKSELASLSPGGV